MSTIDRNANYKAVMALEPVTAEQFADAVAFAREKKRKRPTDRTAIVEPKPVKSPKPARKSAEPKPRGEAKDCLEDGCDKKAYAKGRCSQHYTAHRREDPAIREAANEASRAYRSRAK